MKYKKYLLVLSALLTLSSCTVFNSSNESQTTIDTSNTSSEDIKVNKINLSATSLTLLVNDSYLLEASVEPTSANNKEITFSSLNPNVASISNQGMITAKSVGETQIKALNEASGVYATCNVKVVEEMSSTSTSETSSETSVEEPKELSRMQDAPILHCWNWSMTNVKNKLNDIKNAGFSAIQLSPMQPQKDYYSSDYWGNGWWKLYQPLGFKIATKNNCIGTKSELKELCSSAKALGIDVIMDVVSNHLAGGSATSLNGNVNEYESTIYSQSLIHTNGKCSDWESPKQLLTYAIGDYPDLKTESTVVQDRVTSLLYEYIDCGVNGFRFDAAKHIETPEDGQYASNFWPNVTSKATEYAKSKNLEEPYYYGELLNTIGNGRKYSWYTKYLSITDTRQSSQVLTAVKNKTLTPLSKSYVSGVSPDKLVLWAESHDTYADKSSSGATDLEINKTYIIQTSRKDASTLYFARPGSAKLGEIGSEIYKSPEIKAINEFHKRFQGTSEEISKNNGCFINVRGNLGAVVVGISNKSSNVNVNISNLEKGTYIDLVNNKEYQITSDEVSLTLINDVSILVNKNKSESTLPSISASSYKEIYKDSQDISLNISNATSVTYKINNSEPVNLSNNIISLPASLSNGKVNVVIEAKNDVGKSTLTLSLVKTSTLVNSTFVITDMPNDNYSYLLWAWKDSEGGSWFDLTYENDIAGASIGDKNNFIVVKFNKGTTSSNANWDNKLGQTPDMRLDKLVFSFDEMMF